MIAIYVVKCELRFCYFYDGEFVIIATITTIIDDPCHNIQIILCGLTFDLTTHLTGHNSALEWKNI